MLNNLYVPMTIRVRAFNEFITKLPANFTLFAINGKEKELYSNSLYNENSIFMFEGKEALYLFLIQATDLDAAENQILAFLQQLDAAHSEKKQKLRDKIYSADYIQQKTFLYLDYQVLEEIIQILLDAPNYKIAEGWENISYHTFNLDADAKKWYCKYDQNQVLSYIAGKSKDYPGVQDMMLELFVREYLQPGEYMVFCAW